MFGHLPFLISDISQNFHLLDKRNLQFGLRKRKGKKMTVTRVFPHCSSSVDLFVFQALLALCDEQWRHFACLQKSEGSVSALMTDGKWHLKPRYPISRKKENSLYQKEIQFKAGFWKLASWNLRQNQIFYLRPKRWNWDKCTTKNIDQKELLKLISLFLFCVT